MENGPPPKEPPLWAPPLESRVAKLEWRQDATDNRLHNGAETMAKLDEKLSRPFPRWISAGLVFTVSVFVGGLIWTAARYPERGEFERLRNDQTQLRFDQQQIQSNVEIIKHDQKQTVDAIKELDQKLDQMRQQRDPITGRRWPRSRQKR